MIGLDRDATDSMTGRGADAVAKSDHAPFATARLHSPIRRDRDARARPAASDESIARAMDRATRVELAGRSLGGRSVARTTSPRQCYT